MYISRMDDEELIMTIGLSYLIVNLILHLVFFAAAILDYRWNTINRWLGRTTDKRMASAETSSGIDQHSSCSSLTSEDSLETRRTLHQTVRSFSLLLCSCLLLTNWLCLGLIYFFPKLYPELVRTSTRFCILQSFLLHVLTLFRLHLTIGLRLFWHFCFIVEKGWQTVTYRRISYVLVFVFVCLCLFTLPSLSNEWASVVFDPILHMCIVNYTFNYSYTFFVLTLTCLIPFILLLISHRRHMREIEHRLSKSLLLADEPSLADGKSHFQCSSYAILVWAFVNMMLAIALHVPFAHAHVRIVLLYTQLIMFLLDPIIYLFIFRSLSVIVTLRPLHGAYFV